MTHLTRLDSTQLQIAALAEAMADANPDAAEELGKHLTHQAAQRKRVRGFGVLVRINQVTGRIELIYGR